MTWPRVLMVGLVLCAAVIAVIFRDSFLPSFQHQSSSDVFTPTFEQQYKPVTRVAYTPPASVRFDSPKSAKVMDQGVSTIPVTVVESDVISGSASSDRVIRINDLILTVPKGWAYKNNARDTAVLTSPDFESSNVSQIGLNSVAIGAKILVENRLEAVEPELDSSESFVAYAAEAFSHVSDEGWFVAPGQRVTVGDVPMISMGGHYLDDHGGVVTVAGRRTGKSITLTMMFARTYSPVQGIFEQFLQEVRFVQ